jgi:site-specific recombinase XerD
MTSAPSNPITDDEEVEITIRRRLAEIQGGQNQIDTEQYLRIRAIKERPNTILRDVSDLRDYSRTLKGRSIKSCSLSELQAYEGTMSFRDKSNSPKTKGQKLMTLRTYHRWIHSQDYPGDWAKIPIPNGDEFFLDPGQLIDANDLLIMQGACEDLYEKSTVAFLEESGARSSEFTCLRFESFRKVGQAYRVTFPGKDRAGKRQQRLKTGPRTITLTKCVRLLDLYFEEQKENIKAHPDAYAWPRRRAGGGHYVRQKKDEPSKLCDRLEVVLRERGVQKHIYPHLFRHTAATNKARLGWKESQLNVFFGWSRKGRTASRYVHLVDDDIDQKVLEDAGLAVPRLSTANAPATCKTCGHANLEPSRFCSDCGSILNTKKASREEIETAGLDDEFLRAVEEVIRYVRLTRQLRTSGPQPSGIPTALRL